MEDNKMSKTCLIYGTSVLNLPFGYDEEDEMCTLIKLKITELVAVLAREGVACFVTDCEYGISLWGAEIVLAQKIFTPKITLKLCIPHENQAVKWAPSWRERYFNIHEMADEVEIFNNRDFCTEEMCNEADILIFVGTDSSRVLENFEKAGKTVHKIVF